MKNNEEINIESILYKKQFELKIPIWDYLLNQKRIFKVSILFFILTVFLSFDFMQVLAWTFAGIVFIYNFFYHQNSLTSPIG